LPTPVVGGVADDEITLLDGDQHSTCKPMGNISY
jgi:hypothetical protein